MRKGRLPISNWHSPSGWGCVILRMAPCNPTPFFGVLNMDFVGLSLTSSEVGSILQDWSLMGLGLLAYALIWARWIFSR